MSAIVKSNVKIFIGTATNFVIESGVFAYDPIFIVVFLTSLEKFKMSIFCPGLGDLNFCL